MAQIDVSIDREKDLTVFTVTGALTADEIIECALEYYEKQPTKLVLWDASFGSVHNITSGEFRRIARAMKRLTSMRAGGKTAFVGEYDVDFGMGRMYETYSEIEQLPVVYRTFRSRDEAERWLGIQDERS